MKKILFLLLINSTCIGQHLIPIMPTYNPYIDTNNTGWYYSSIIPDSLVPAIIDDGTDGYGFWGDYSEPTLPITIADELMITRSMILDYSERCYNDSIYGMFINTNTIYSWKHKEPTFEGFIKYLKDKY